MVTQTTLVTNTKKQESEYLDGVPIMFLANIESPDNPIVSSKKERVFCT